MAGARWKLALCAAATAMLMSPAPASAFPQGPSGRSENTASTAEGYVVRGVVRDRMGAPLAHAEVTAAVPGGATFVDKANKKGEYLLTVPAGTYELDARTTRYEGLAGMHLIGGIEHFTVAADAREDFSFPIQIGSIFVRARNGDGTTAVNATISAFEAEAALPQLSSTPQGTPVYFSGYGMVPDRCAPGTADCTVRALVGATIEARASIGSEAFTKRARAQAAIPAGELTLTFPASDFNVSGHIDDGSGERVVGAEVWAGEPGEPTYTTTSNTSGEYLLRLPAGVYELGVRIHKYEKHAGIGAAAGIEHLVLTKDLVDDFAFPTQVGSVAITAQDAQGNPIPAAEITAYEIQAAPWLSASNREGTTVLYGGSGLQRSRCKPQSKKCTVQAILGSEIQAQANLANGTSTEPQLALAQLPPAEIALAFE